MILLSAVLPELPSAILPALHGQCRIWQSLVEHASGEEYPPVTVLCSRELFSCIYYARNDGAFVDSRLTAFCCGDVNILLWPALAEHTALIGGEGVEEIRSNVLTLAWDANAECYWDDSGAPGDMGGPPPTHKLVITPPTTTAA